MLPNGEKQEVRSIGRCSDVNETYLHSTITSMLQRHKDKVIPQHSGQEARVHVINGVRKVPVQGA